jgi:DNA-binding response OmpR family regulator
MSIDVNSRARFNLKDAHVLLLERGVMDMEILVHILVGIGAKQLTKCDTIEEAKGHLGKINFDLAIVDAFLGDEDGYDFVSWMRRNAPEPNKFMPVIVVSAHTRAPHVVKARDCGAHFIVAKPLTPIVLIERIFWVARAGRSFVMTDKYTGPDRRFKFDGPPTGEVGRRYDDLKEDLGIALEPNMSQDQIDALMLPRKVNL